MVLAQFRRFRFSRALAFFAGCAGILTLATVSDEIRSNAVQTASAEYSLAVSNHLAQPTNTTFAWKLARACFELSEFATNDTQLATLANEGIAAARIVVDKAPEEAAGHHYLAVNLGQLARTRLLTALGLVKEMERAFLNSIKANERFHYAGSHRSLAMLYGDAPGWPVSIGSRSKARKHFERAIELFPDYPDNHLSALEAYAAWEQRDYLRAGLPKFRNVLAAAKQKYSGREWAQSWSDWDARWKAIQSKATVLLSDSK